MRNRESLVPIEISEKEIFYNIYNSHGRIYKDIGKE